MLNREQNFFLSVLADHLNGQLTAPVPGLDWKSIHDMAVRHQVSALFCTQCGAFLPQESELQFLQEYGAAIADSTARRKIAADLEREFTRHRLPYIIVKGIVVAECYPQPELRTMGDIDVIVKPEDKDRAHEILRELGFSSHTGDHEWYCEKNFCMIELHHRLLYDDDPFNTPEEVVFCEKIWEYARPVPGSSRCELDSDFHFLFLVLHLKKHIVASGAGFRQFMDLAVAARKWPLNWNRLRSWFAELDLLLFAQMSLTFCQNWFGMVLPLTTEKLTADSAAESAQQIFYNGAFGYRDEARIAEWSRRPWFMLFPGYDTLRKQKKYRFLEGKPWLLPVAWIYRIGFLLCCRNSSIRIKMLVSSKVRKRNKTLKKMGL